MSEVVFCVYFTAPMYFTYAMFELVHIHYYIHTILCSVSSHTKMTCQQCLGRFHVLDYNRDSKHIH